MSGKNNIKIQSSTNNTKKNDNENKSSNIFYLLPIIISVAILPLIMRLHNYNAHLSSNTWFSDNDLYYDFFLYYKQWIFVGVTALMAIIILYQKYKDKNALRYSHIFVPLAAYALLAILSTLGSKHKFFSFNGIYEQFESIFVLIGYSLVVYYTFLFIKTEKDVEYIIRAILICTIILSFIGITQILGKDFLMSSQGWRLVTPREYWNSKDSFTFNFIGTVYLTLYNPNYVGVFTPLILPILLISAAFTKKLLLKITFLVAALGIVISLIGSKSSTGIISIIFGFILMIILFRRYLIKYYFITIPSIVLLIVALFIFNHTYNNFIVNQFQKISNMTKTAPLLSEIQTNDNNLVVKYNNNTMNIEFSVSENGTCLYNIYDNSDTSISYVTDTVNGPITLQDSRFPGFIITPVLNTDNVLAFRITIDGADWYFTNQRGDNTYYYINEYNKYVKLNTAPSVLFKGYERYASGRGYLWSRTLPLLKDHVLLGSGADTFIFEFPNTDAINKYNYGFHQQVITKPHNLYLQIGVQTGVLSLIAFLAFYLMYFVSSLKLYLRGTFNNYYSVIGVAILIGTSSYMISGIANDSCIATAPVFWTLMGLGIAVNLKAKQQAQKLG